MATNVKNLDDVEFEIKWSDKPAGLFQRFLTLLHLNFTVPLEISGYTKNNYEVAKLISRVPNAIENEKLFCEDEALLIDEVGSRIGILFQELRV